MKFSIPVILTDGGHIASSCTQNEFTITFYLSVAKRYNEKNKDINLLFDSPISASFPPQSLYEVESSSLTLTVIKSTLHIPSSVSTFVALAFL